MVFRHMGELTYSVDQSAVGLRSFLNDQPRIEAPHEPEAKKMDVKILGVELV